MSIQITIKVRDVMILVKYLLLWAIKRIYYKVGNSGVKISIIGMEDTTKEHTEIFNAIKNKNSKDASKRI